MNSNEGPMLEIKNLDAAHGTFKVLYDVSLSIWKEELVGLIGANTAGKSTLLDTISGFLHPLKGKITFMGDNISAMNPFEILDLGITHVPEGRRVFPEMTISENLNIGSYSRKARKRKEKNLEKIFNLFPILKDRRNQLAATLSGGEQQMLAIGRGLMSSPKLMLLDEISLGLAPRVVNELYKVLKEIRQEGMTVLLVEQNVRKSLAETDRAYILESGRVVLSGKAEELQNDQRVKKAYFGI